MAKPRGGHDKSWGSRAGTFSWRRWFSFLFDLTFNRHKEPVVIASGCFFFHVANWVIREFVSPDPSFVNTAVSLLHSSITSISGRFSLPEIFKHSNLVKSPWPW